MTSLPLFDPDDRSGYQALLTCCHHVPCPPPTMLPRRADDWWASLYCPQCRRQREVVSLLNPAKEASQ